MSASRHFGRSALRTLLLAFGLATMGVQAAHAVSVSPTALYIDSRTRTGMLTLHNPGTLAEEITIEFAFGYPQTDTAGNLTVPVTREPPAGEPSAMAWMRAFPRRLVLQPGQRQVVRVMVEPPADLPDGEYWARILVSSRGGQPPIEQTQGEVRLQLDVATTLVMAANFRKGAVGTGLEVAAETAGRTADGVTLQVDLRRTGNAAFLGRMRADLVNARGDVLGTAWDDLAVYREVRRRHVIPLPPGTEGPLFVQVTIDTEREDLPAGGALPVAPLSRRIPVN
jgi:hypothetical protein